MSVSMALLALVAAQTFSMPLQKPPPTVERPIAPVEAAGQAFDAACEGSDDWDKPAPPVGVYGNTYYVGTCGISAILITSPQGHILIDSGTEAGAELVAENIRALGFRLTDVKFLLHSHDITTTLAAWRASQADRCSDRRFAGGRCRAEDRCCGTGRSTGGYAEGLSGCQCRPHHSGRRDRAPGRQCDDCGCNAGPHARRP